MEGKNNKVRPEKKNGKKEVLHVPSRNPGSILEVALSLSLPASPAILYKVSTPPPETVAKLLSPQKPWLKALMPRCTIIQWFPSRAETSGPDGSKYNIHRMKKRAA